MAKEERWNHPAHYQGENGIETIDVIRHYTCDIANALKYLMRAGRKQEDGISDTDKEVEDLKKALWYIEDYRQQTVGLAAHQAARKEGVEHPATALLRKTSGARVTRLTVRDVTGYTVGQIAGPYCEPVQKAIYCLLLVGIVRDGHVFVSEDWEQRLQWAVEDIQQRILDIEAEALRQEAERTREAMNAFLTGEPIEAVAGEDYISKPGGVRKTEPEEYDPLNMITVFGRAYCLTRTVRRKASGAVASPCENCDLQEVCFDDFRHPSDETCRHLCDRLHQAETCEYYREVGRARYFPRKGSVEVVDEHREMEQQMKRLEAEDGE